MICPNMEHSIEDLLAAVILEHDCKRVSELAFTRRNSPATFLDMTPPSAQNPA